VAHVSILSAHDVTVLAVLHALGAPLVLTSSWWPPFGCVLLIELLRPGPRDKGLYSIRVRLAPEVVPSGKEGAPKLVEKEGLGWASDPLTVDELESRWMHAGLIRRTTKQRPA
jgi:hypothetical protein